VSNLLASLRTAGNTLDVFQQALSVVQNNVNNSSTPGYARQQVNLVAQPLDITSGLAGGVAARGLIDSRSQYADEEVQRQVQTLGQFTAQAQSTSTIQSYFDVSGTTGVSAALSNLFSSFSAWATTPNDATARQTVLANAGDVASSIQGLSNSLSQTSGQLDSQIGSTVDQINTITQQIQQYNVQRLRETAPDPGTDAQLHSALENLSQLTNFTTVTQTDGTVTVMMSGGSPLVIGTQQYALSTSVSVDPGAANPKSPPTIHVLDSQGQDITSEATSGQLGGLLDARNRVLGSILGDATQPGTLNQFAQGLADTVNQVLESGTVSSDPGAAQGVALFSYDSSDPTLAAQTLTVNPAITADQLAPVDSSGNSNGNANQLAGLGSSTATLGTINGMGLVKFFASIASSVGQENQTATNNEQAQTQVVSQATSLRNQISAVSLDQEAVNVLQFQRAYQATAQVVTILNSLADTLLAMIPPA
jgi:flagellar hook-associated protein 1 FlgK